MMTRVCYAHGRAELNLGIGQVTALNAVIIIIHLYTSISINMTQEELRLGMSTHAGALPVQS
jgi:hypothetical protein